MAVTPKKKQLFQKPSHMTFAAKVIQQNLTLVRPSGLPLGIKTMNPYEQKEVQETVTQFYTKYFNDNNKRTLILGINPGRFGAGITGIPFTDPIRLAEVCGIPNTFNPKPELSSLFIYEMITAFGGPERFYQQFYINSVCPLGFTLDGKNLNYYDVPALQNALTPYIEENIKSLIDIGLHTDFCFCLGEGKNYQFLSKFNESKGYFGEVIPLSHPRFIMQYKLKTKGDYINPYIKSFQENPQEMLSK